jgi:hypothetical protein
VYLNFLAKTFMVAASSTITLRILERHLGFLGHSSISLALLSSTLHTSRMKFLPHLHKKSASASASARTSEINATQGVLTSTSMPAEWLQSEAQAISPGDEVRRRVARVMRWDAGLSASKQREPAQPHPTHPAKWRQRKCPLCFQVYDGAEGHRHPQDAVARHQAKETLLMLQSDLIECRSRSSSLGSNRTTASQYREHDQDKRLSRFTEVLDDVEADACSWNTMNMDAAAHSAREQMVPIYLESGIGGGEHEMATFWHLNGQRMNFS